MMERKRDSSLDSTRYDITNMRGQGFGPCAGARDLYCSNLNLGGRFNGSLLLGN